MSMIKNMKEFKTTLCEGMIVDMKQKLRSQASWMLRMIRNVVLKEQREYLYVNAII